MASLSDGDDMSSEVRWVAQTDGSLCYEVIGEGPLVLCLPGEGDVRDSFYELAMGLVGEGFQVAVADLRGQGDSAGNWSRFDAVALAGDIGAILDAEHAGQALLVGASLSAASTAFFAAHHPERVAGLVGLAPTRRNHAGFERGTLMPAMAWAMLRRPLLGGRLWAHYWSSLFVTHAPEWLSDHRTLLTRSFSDPGALRAVRELLTARLDTTHLSTLDVPVLDFVGLADPDFDDPRAELRWTEGTLPMAAVLGLPGVGHFPHAERPDLVVPSIVDFARTLFAADEPEHEMSSYASAIAAE